jgi:hypothetical protein
VQLEKLLLFWETADSYDEAMSLISKQPGMVLETDDFVKTFIDLKKKRTVILYEPKKPA